MRKVLSLLFILSVALVAVAQDSQIPSDTLIWRANRPLIFNDFTGEPIESSNLMGEAFCLILTTFERPTDSMYTDISAYAVFDRTNSWMSRRTRPDEMLLFQVTFNVFEVYARKLRKLAQEIHTDPYSQMIFQKAYSSSLPLLTHECNELKRETRMGTDKVKLKEWDEKVKKELNELQAYEH